MAITTSQIDQLVRAASEARASAYAPFSNFGVGAAALTADGRTFRGANVENSSYGLTVCAERVAIGSAVTAGVKPGGIVAVAVATDVGATPCGACRQVLLEFGEEIEVLIVDTSENQPLRRTTVGELLPDAFRFAGPRG